MINRTSIKPVDAAVTFDKVTVVSGGVKILDSISAVVPQKSCTAIIGPNGAGKTTLLLCLLKQFSYSGKIYMQPLSGKTLRLGYVPQRLHFDRLMPLKVLEFMVMGWQRSPLWLGCRDRYKRKALELLESVNASELITRRIGALSGGELQRVLLALALGNDPQLLVLDEPAAGVDYQGENLICELLEKLRKDRGFTQLMVSHDLATVASHATYVICLNKRIAAQGVPQEVLNDETLRNVFGLHMGLADRSRLALNTSACNCRSENGGHENG